MVLNLRGKKFFVDGCLLRIMRLDTEYYERLEEPSAYISTMKAGTIPADIFTFVDRFSTTPRYGEFHFEDDPVAVLNISTFDQWWKKQINDKTRNMIRRAQKAKVEVKLVPFSDDLINGIKKIYDETPMRQGKAFKHYQKPFDVLKKEHATFLETSQFLGAFFEGELIGFIKLVHDDGLSHLMQILSMVKHRDKAPTNALMAKAVETCAERHVPLLHYSSWSRRGLGDFKKHHGFEPLIIPRYYVPLNLRGEIALKLKLHKKLAERLPEDWVDYAVRIREHWNQRYGRIKGVN